MNHKIVSFYAKDLPEEIAILQKKVFEKFNLELEQVCFDTSSHLHSGAINKYVRENNDWDSISIFDIDCIPIEANCIDRAIDIIKDGNTVYGNAQIGNSYVFIGASFLNFTREVWNKVVPLWDNPITPNLSSDVFYSAPYPNPKGDVVVHDVGEIFLREAERAGSSVVVAYPTHVHGNPDWKYGPYQYFGDRKFEYGIGTEFESGTYHNFQIRFQNRQAFFVDYCKKILE